MPGYRSPPALDGEWRRHLLEAVDAGGLVGALGRIVSECPGVAQAWVVWELGHATLGDGALLPQPSEQAIAAAGRAALARAPVTDGATGLGSVPPPVRPGPGALQPQPAAP